MMDKEVVFSDNPIDYNSLDFKKERFYHNLAIPVVISEDDKIRYNLDDGLFSANEYRPLIEQVRLQMKAEIWAHTVGEKTITLDRPTFLDWLLRRRRKVTVKASDMFIEPPALPDNMVRIYKWEWM